MRKFLKTKVLEDIFQGREYYFKKVDFLRPYIFFFTEFWVFRYVYFSKYLGYFEFFEIFLRKWIFEYFLKLFIRKWSFEDIFKDGCLDIFYIFEDVFFFQGQHCALLENIFGVTISWDIFKNCWKLRIFKNYQRRHLKFLPKIWLYIFHFSNSNPLRKPQCQRNSSRFHFFFFSLLIL